MKSTLLFLCTGNYYRSRFAEVLFNTWASEQKLSWQAISRALAKDLSRKNVGPISPHALRGLTARGLTLSQPVRFPRALQPFELLKANRIIALNEKEHRPLLAERFDGWENSVEYWAIDDVDVDSPENVLPKLERDIRQLLERLAANRDHE